MHGGAVLSYTIHLKDTLSETIRRKEEINKLNEHFPSTKQLHVIASGLAFLSLSPLLIEVSVAD